MPRQYTAEEIRDQLLDHIGRLPSYWNTVKGRTTEEKLRGLAFSILSALDGCSMGLPGFVLVPQCHPEDPDYLRDQGENWYPVNEDLGDLVHLGDWMLHEHFYRHVPKSLPEVFSRILLDKKLTVAVAESLTAGHVQAQISSIEGASDYFRGGLTAYTLEQKVEILGVDGTHASQVNCVSAQVALEMARGARRLYGADVGIATTGYASQVYEGLEVQGQCAHIAVVTDHFERAMLWEPAQEIPRAQAQEEVARTAIEFAGDLLTMEGV